MVAGTNTGANRPQAVIIASVDFIQDIVVLRNVSGATVDLSAGDMCRPFVYHAFSAHPASNQLAAGAELRVHLTTAGTDTATDVYFNQATLNLGTSDEIMLYRTAAAHQQNNIEAYVRYGPSAPSGRQAQAVAVGLWTTGDSVSICPEHDAFAASGVVKTAAGFSSLFTSDTCP